MDATLVVLVVLTALGLGGGGGYLLRNILVKKGVATAGQSASGILREAEEQKKRLLLEAQEEALRVRSSVEEELREGRAEVQRREHRISNREEQMDHRAENLERRERGLSNRENELETLKGELEELKVKEDKQLESLSGLTTSEARDLLMQRAEGDIQQELNRRYREIEQHMREEADQQARKTVTLAIHRLASDVVSENTTAIVPLPNDEMKGRIIGREGRNIRAIEAATGVDIIIDDTPEAVTVSCFDPVRREIAKVALAKLVQDGRIHPARVEEVVKKSEEEVEEVIRKEGERAIFETGVRSMNPEIIRLLGRLKYRYSYGENILQHSIEVANLAGMLAAEIADKEDAHPPVPLPRFRLQLISCRSPAGC